MTKELGIYFDKALTFTQGRHVRGVCMYGTEICTWKQETVNCKRELIKKDLLNV